MPSSISRIAHLRILEVALEAIAITVAITVTEASTTKAWRVGNTHRPSLHTFRRQHWWSRTELGGTWATSSRSIGTDSHQAVNAIHPQSFQGLSCKLCFLLLLPEQLLLHLGSFQHLAPGILQSLGVSP